EEGGRARRERTGEGAAGGAVLARHPGRLADQACVRLPRHHPAQPTLRDPAELEIVEGAARRVGGAKDGGDGRRLGQGAPPRTASRCEPRAVPRAALAAKAWFLYGGATMTSRGAPSRAWGATVALLLVSGLAASAAAEEVEKVEKVEEVGDEGATAEGEATPD